MKYDKDYFLAVVCNWKVFWMNQTQNGEEDQMNYFNRAFGVDSNMKHNLADRITETVQPLLYKIERYEKALMFYADKENFSIEFSELGFNYIEENNNHSSDFSFGKAARVVLEGK